MASRTLRVEIVGDASKSRKAFQEASDGADGLATQLNAAGKKMQDFGKSMSIGVTLPVAAVGVKMFDLASDTNESLSKVNTVFGDSAKAIQDWAKTADTSLGISSQEALEASGTLGNLATAMGLTKKDAAEMSTSMVGLASDLASFNNADPKAVLEALRAGLLGEAEPLRQFGVNLSAARIESEALQLGLVKAPVNLAAVEAAMLKVDKATSAVTKAEREHGAQSSEAVTARNKLALAEQGLTKAMEGGKVELTAAQKMQAAQAIILKDTTTAQGDFARTADGAANSQRTLTAQIKNAGATIGQKLMPIGQKLIGFVADLVGKFSSLDSGTQNIILVIIGVVAAMGPLVGVLGTLGTVLGFIAANPIVLIIAAIAAIGVALYMLYQKSEAFRAFVDSAWQFIQQAIASAVDALRPVFDAFIAVIHDVWDVIIGIKDFIVGVFTGDWQQAWNGIKEIFAGVWNLIIDYFKYVWEVIKLVATAAWNVVIAGLSAAWNWVAGIFRSVWDGIIGYYSWVWNTVVGAASNGLDWLLGIVRSITETISGVWNKAWDGIGSFFSRIWDGIVSSLKGAINSVIGFLNTLISAWNDIRIEFSTPDVPGTDWGGQDIKVDFPDMPKIPRLAGGGIIMPSPGGTFANIAEAGVAEAVIPLTPSILSQLGGGGVTVHVTVQGSVIRERDLGETVYKALLDLQRRNGSLALT